jgi:hypothetical protein
MPTIAYINKRLSAKRMRLIELRRSICSMLAIETFLKEAGLFEEIDRNVKKRIADMDARMHCDRDAKKRFTITRVGRDGAGHGVYDHQEHEYIAWFVSRTRCENYCASIQQRLRT